MTATTVQNWVFIIIAIQNNFEQTIKVKVRLHIIT